MAVLGAVAYRQQVTYWSPAVDDGYGGQTYGAPVILMCRWEDRVESFLDLSGETHKSKAIVYTQVEVELEGYMVKGDHTADPDPTLVDGALHIQRFDVVPDLRGLYETMRAFL